MNKRSYYILITLFIATGITICSSFVHAENGNTGKTNLIRKIPSVLQNIASSDSSSKQPTITKQHIAILESRAYEVSDKTYVESKKDPSKGFVDLFSPKNSLILDKRPVFKWEPVPGAQKYEFKLVNSLKELWHTSTNNTEVRLPADMPDLEEGKFYFWAVRAVGVSNYYSPYSYFYIATTKEQNEMNAALNYFDRTLSSKTPEEKEIILASFYESKGYYDLAEKHYLSAKNYIHNPDEANDLDILMGNLYVKTDRLNKAVKLLGLKQNN